MSILITGATGYLGSHLTQQLSDQGHEIRILCRTEPADALFRAKNISIVMGDLQDPASIRRAMKGIRKVYHLAAYARLWSRDPDRYRQFNVEGTRHVLKAAAEEQVQKMVHVSTAGVVGPSMDKPMDEVMPRNADFFNSYERTKWQAEQLCLAFSQEGFPVTIVNPSRVYGPGLDTGSNPFTKIIELFIQGKWRIIPGSGKDIGSYCYVDDVVDGMMKAMEKGRPGERYLLGGVNASFNEFLSTVSDLSGVRKHAWHMPFVVLEAFAFLQIMLAKTTGKPPLVTPDWVRKYRFNWALDSSKAENELDYHIRPLAEGIEKTIGWIRETRLR